MASNLGGMTDGRVDVTLAVPTEHATAVAEAMGIDPGSDAVAAVSDVLAGIAKAAFAEHMLSIAGERVPAGVRDLRELRLQLLAQHLPKGLPTDVQIARLFHLTQAQARNLVAGARARYPAEVQLSLNAAAADALRNADRGDDEDTVRITASNSLAAYLRELVTSASNAQAPTPRADASNRYDVTRSAVEVLCPRVGITVADVKALPPKKKA
jgi:hypothetical protein